MVKKIVVSSPEPEPAPAPARITVGEKILARMDEVLARADLQEKRLVGLESQIWAAHTSIRELTSMLNEVGDRLERLEVVAISARDNASAAEVAAEEARKEVEWLTEAMPQVEEVVNHIRSQERIEWLASLKPAF
jgi:methyl-accepting chemotaxis protein